MSGCGCRKVSPQRPQVAWAGSWCEALRGAGRFLVGAIVSGMWMFRRCLSLCVVELTCAVLIQALDLDSVSSRLERFEWFQERFMSSFCKPGVGTGSEL
jgi:hypothetical protein